MTHVRQQIRERVVEVLKGGHSAAGENVYAHRVHPIPSEKVPGSRAPLPAIGVLTTDEQSSLAAYDPDLSGKRYNRTIEISLDLYAIGDDSDDQVDALAVDVERLMEVDDTLGGFVRNLVLTASRDVYSGEGERIAGRKRLTYQATYKTKAGVAETAL
jgi:hypothetical protein